MLKPVIPGVFIIDECSAWALGGGVEGAKILDDLAPGLAGDGDVAKYKSKSAPSSPPALRWRAARLRVGGGVRGGEARKAEFIEKECVGRSLSSSSETCPKGGEAGMVETSDAKDRLGPWELAKWASWRW